MRQVTKRKGRSSSSQASTSFPCLLPRVLTCKTLQKIKCQTSSALRLTILYISRRKLTAYGNDQSFAMCKVSNPVFVHVIACSRGSDKIAARLLCKAALAWHLIHTSLIIVWYLVYLLFSIIRPKSWDKIPDPCTEGTETHCTSN